MSYRIFTANNKIIPPMIAKGKLIVLEGLDRSGKSTISKYTQEILSHKTPTIAINFPDRTTPIGKMINEFLSNKTQLNNQTIPLLFSANRWEKNKEIEDTLSRGTNIVCDRYWYSGVAYSVAKGMDLEWCMAADRGLHKPDLVLYLKAQPEVLAKRASFGQQRFERIEFQKKVKEAFERLFEKEKTNIVTIQTGEHCLQEVKKMVEQSVVQLFE